MAVRPLLHLKVVVKKEYARQKKLRDIVNLPYWKREAERTVEVEEFLSLELRDLQFSYRGSKLPVIEFGEQKMLFEGQEVRDRGTEHGREEHSRPHHLQAVRAPRGRDPPQQHPVRAYLAQ